MAHPRNTYTLTEKGKIAVSGTVIINAEESTGETCSDNHCTRSHVLVTLLREKEHEVVTRIVHDDGSFVQWTGVCNVDSA